LNGMEVPRQYMGANVRLENNLGLASLKMAGGSRIARHVISDYENSVNRPSFNIIKWRTRRQ
jgi:hypothetical protein